MKTAHTEFERFSHNKNLDLTFSAIVWDQNKTKTSKERKNPRHRVVSQGFHFVCHVHHKCLRFLQKKIPNPKKTRTFLEIWEHGLFEVSLGRPVNSRPVNCKQTQISLLGQKTNKTSWFARTKLLGLGKLTVGATRTNVGTSQNPKMNVS